jgi:hypothetical protein
MFALNNIKFHSKYLLYHLWQRVLTQRVYRQRNRKPIKMRNLQGAVGYMVEAASKKDFAPGKERVFKEILISTVTIT